MNSPFGFGQTYTPNYQQGGGMSGPPGMDQGGGQGQSMFDQSNPLGGFSGGGGGDISGIINGGASQPGVLNGPPNLPAQSFSFNPTLRANPNASFDPNTVGNAGQMFNANLGLGGDQFYKFGQPLPSYMNGNQRLDTSGKTADWYGINNNFQNYFDQLNLYNQGGYWQQNQARANPGWNSNQSQYFNSVNGQNPNDLMSLAQSQYSNLYNKFAARGTFGVPGQ